MLNGIIMGVIFSVNFLFSVSKVTLLITLTNLLAVLIVVLIYRLSVKFRDTECEGFISYRKAFFYILYSFFFAALISSVVKYIYFQYINPSYLETMFQETMKMFSSLKYPINDATEEQTRKMLKPASYTLIYIWVNIFMGLIVGLIMAAFIKKEKSIFKE